MDGQYWSLTYTLIQCEITPVYVIIPVCLSLRMAKEVSKLVLKRSGKLIKEELFLDLPCAKAPQLHRPWSLDGIWYRAGSAGLAAKSKWPMCVRRWVSYFSGPFFAFLQLVVVQLAFASSRSLVDTQKGDSPNFSEYLGCLGPHIPSSVSCDPLP